MEALNMCGQNNRKDSLRGFARKTLLGLFIGALGALLTAPGLCAQDSAQKCPPPTRRDSVVDNYFGTKIADPYQWLEKQYAPETRAWIAAQDRCTFAVLDKLPGREAIATRLSALMKVGATDVPLERGGRYFFMRRGAHEDLYLIYMRKGLAGSDKLLVDPRPLSRDHSTSVALRAVSEDGQMIAYGVRKGGQDQLVIHFLNVDTGKTLPDVLPHADYFGISITPDLKGVYYSWMTPQGPLASYHVMGTPASSDKVLFGKGLGREKIVLTRLSPDGKYLLYTVALGAGSERSEIYVQDVQSHGPIVPVVKDMDGFFEAQIAGDTLYLLTNWRAPNWRVLEVNLRHPAEKDWREVIPESSERLSGIELAGGKLIGDYVHDATSALRVFSAEGKPEGPIALPAMGTASMISSEWKSNNVFFNFRSFPIPPTIYRYDVATGHREVWAKSDVPMDSKDFTVAQVWYHSKDGTRVPMFLFYRKGLKRDGKTPTLLTGYGGFDLSETPTFRPEAVVWAEEGGVVAVANLRGGGEFGEAWHKAGMLGNKQNVFDDFEAAAEWLIRNQYTNPKKLAIYGMSNGGLLVGAALTQRPDLFRAVVCMYPLLDMLRYQKFFVARWWVPEYGSSDNPQQFKYLLKYSPYQNVHKGTKYPAVLFITGDGDTRVAPLHARKMTALLQASTGSKRPILLMYDTKSGHSGGRPVGKQIQEDTNILSFLFWQLHSGPDARTLH